MLQKFVARVFKRQFLLVALTLVNSILLIGNAVWFWSNKTTSSPPSHQYPLLSKRIFAENQNDTLINFTPLRSALREYVEKQPNTIGLYFEYVPTGTSIGINDGMEIKLASLIKVPVVMAIYKEVEHKRITLDQTITLQESHLDKNFGNLWKQGAGKKLTVKQAVDLALKESDNTASRALVSLLSPGKIDEVFDALDIPKHKDGAFSVISPKAYSSILRSLYLSSYLTRDYSNELLTILSATKFSDKIASGVPKHILVAHKIGMFESPHADTIHSDCGIIYVPNRPYMLCVMLQGNDQQAAQQMRLLSKMVYGYVEKVGRNVSN